MALPIGTLADYLASTSQGLNPGTLAYSTNPIQPIGLQPASYTPPTFSSEGQLTGNFLTWPQDECQCGQLCSGLLHETTTDFWFEFYVSDCGGVLAGNPLPGDTSNCPPSNLCDSCWDDFKVPFDEGANDALSQIGEPVLANLFPAWSLQMLGLTGREPAQFDWIVVRCTPPADIVITITFQIGADGDIVQNPVSPPPPASGGHVGFVDPPLPLASDGIGFSLPAGPYALPVHPVLSAHAVRQTCGACGDDSGDEEIEDAL